jgi:hypothetical protein
MLLYQAKKAEQEQGALAGGVLSAFFLSDTRSRPPITRADLIGHRMDMQQLSQKLLGHDPLFQLQVLVRVESEIEERANAHMESLLSCFDTFASQNWFKVAGFNLLGLAFLGADILPWKRWNFDRRFNTGLFRPSRTNLVTAREILGFLKPPTKRCQASNLVTLGGSIPPPPPGLPTFRYQPNLLPLGKVRDSSGRVRLVGVPLSDTLFAYMAGRSRYGKTETAINQFLHLVRSGNGGLFLDPHEDALRKIKAHLTEEGLAESIVEIDLTRGGHQSQLSWNLFARRGGGAKEAEAQVAAIVDSFASVMQWDERNSRAVNLITQAAQSLIELSRQLPSEFAPTIFPLP